MVLVEEGDMDMQAGIIMKALRDPELLTLMTKVVGRVFLAETLSLFGF